MCVCGLVTQDFHLLWIDRICSFLVFEFFVMPVNDGIICTVKLLIQARSRIEAVSPIQAGVLGRLF